MLYGPDMTVADRNEESAILHGCALWNLSHVHFRFSGLLQRNLDNVVTDDQICHQKRKHM